MFFRGLVRVSTPIKMLGVALGSFAGGIHFQEQRKMSAMPPRGQQSIHKALQVTPEQVRAILTEEKASFQSARKELESMKLLLSKKQIDQAIEKMAGEIAKEFEGEEHLLVLTMLQGASYFATDLKRQLFSEHHLLFKEDAIRVTRYGDSHHGGQPKVERLPEPKNVVGRKILIIEDLIEGGVTLQWTIDALIKLGAKREDIYVAVLTNKVNARQEGYESVQPNYCGFTMEYNYWVAGMGCDNKGYLRPAKDLMYFPPEEQQILGYGKK